jgi:hypothetical protein
MSVFSINARSFGGHAQEITIAIVQPTRGSARKDRRFASQTSAVETNATNWQK